MSSVFFDLESALLASFPQGAFYKSGAVRPQDIGDSLCVAVLPVPASVLRERGVDSVISAMKEQLPPDAKLYTIDGRIVRLSAKRHKNAKSSLVGMVTISYLS